MPNLSDLSFSFFPENWEKNSDEMDFRKLMTFIFENADENKNDNLKFF